jgi:hypothetical protein
VVAAVGVVFLALAVLADVRIDWARLSDVSAVLQSIAAVVAALVARLIADRLRPPPYDPVEASEAAEEVEAPAPADAPKPVPATAKAVAELAAKAHSDEFDQSKALDTKTLGLVAFTGAALLFSAGVAAKPPDALNDAQKGAFVLATLPIIFVFVLALLLLFAALRLRDYQEVDVSQWARYSVLARPVEEVQAEMASTYEDLIEFNHNVNADKAQLQGWGLRLLVTGVVLLVLLLAWLPIKWLAW